MDFSPETDEERQAMLDALSSVRQHQKMTEGRQEFL